MSAQEIPVIINIQAENDRQAETLKQQLHNRGIWTINVMGAPGAGKTSVISGLIQALLPDRSYVLEGDIESDLDTQKLRAAGVETLQINTHGACHLDAPVVAAPSLIFRLFLPASCSLKISATWSAQPNSTLVKTSSCW